MTINNTLQISKIHLLKEARRQLLKLHKDLIDAERNILEKNSGELSSGQFLQILLNDENFIWLRKFSGLIVEIDEMFDLDDGYSDEMVEKHFIQMNQMISFTSSDMNFNNHFIDSVQNNPNVKKRYEELKNLLSNK
jgi:hypothetical protein